MNTTELSHDAFVQMAQIASRYFEQGDKQDAIAREYNLSQAEVSRYIREARRQKIVRIEIDPYYLREQAQALRAQFPHLKEVILRPAFQVAQPHGDGALLEALGTACADYFLQIVGHNATLGISCGLAVEAFANAVGRHSATHTTVLPVACEIYSLLTLMASDIQGLTPAGLVANLTRWLPDSTGYAFHLPHDDTQGIRAYLNKRPIQQLQQTLPNLQYYIMGIGYIEEAKTRQRIGRVHHRVSYEFNALIDRLDLIETLQKYQAIGESIYQPYDKDGNILLTQPELKPLEESMIYLSLEELQKRLQQDKEVSVIGIAGGQVKHAAVYAALQAKIFNVLVTDSKTAEYVLQQENPPDEAAHPASGRKPRVAGGARGGRGAQRPAGA